MEGLVLTIFDFSTANAHTGVALAEDGVRAHGISRPSRGS